MRTMNLVGCALASLLFVGIAAAQAATSEADDKAVLAAEHQWLKSQQTNNTELLAPLLADKVVETNDEGKVFDGKDAVLADAKAVTWSSADYTEMKVNVFGHTAVATGVFTGKGKDAAGKSVEERVRFTDTWVKMPNGKWQCVATADSSIKK